MTWHGNSSELSGRVTISEDERLILIEKAKGSDYWASTYNFLTQNDGRLLINLSPKQRDWFYSAHADLQVLVWKLEARIASGLEPDLE